MLIADKQCSDVCCDEFLVSQIDCKSKQVKQRHEKFDLQSVRGKTPISNAKKYQNLSMNNKVRGDKNAFYIFFDIC